ncbi:hypothetical protein [Streptomyces sp. NPDC001568]|uniref:hypothetical protein n=1 Tax=Streptomyces sp. NPDC001568 TaxID=3364588 RepID=UPI0036849A1D
MGAPEPPAPERHSLPRSFLHALTADPAHLPELLAALVVEQVGTTAGRSVAKLRERRPDASLTDLRAAVIVRGRRRSQVEGACVGGPFMLLVPVAFCAALIEQLRMALELACLAGRDPSDPERAAELLVLQGVHPDTDRARTALLAVSRQRPRTNRKGRGRTRTGWAVVSRMARLLGLVTPDDAVPRPSRPARARQWATLILVVLAGTVVPLIWLPYLGFAYHQSTNQLAGRAVQFYFGDGAGAEHLASERPQLGVVAALLRAALALLIPIGAIVIALALDLRIDGSHWPVIAVVLIAVSTLTGIAWYIHHRRAPRKE